MQKIALRGVKIMAVTGAKNKIASLYPNLHNWIQKVVPQDHEQHMSHSFQKDLEPLLELKSNFDALERKSFKMNYMMRELKTFIR